MSLIDAQQEAVVTQYAQVGFVTNKKQRKGKKFYFVFVTYMVRMLLLL
jgi:hypothetical protein